MLLIIYVTVLMKILNTTYANLSTHNQFSDRPSNKSKNIFYRNDDENPCIGKETLTVIPLPTSCIDFIICVNETPSIGNCPPGHLFNGEACTNEELVDCTTIGPLTEVPTTTIAPTTTPTTSTTTTTTTTTRTTTTTTTTTTTSTSTTPSTTTEEPTSTITTTTTTTTAENPITTTITQEITTSSYTIFSTDEQTTISTNTLSNTTTTENSTNTSFTENPESTTTIIMSTTTTTTTPNGNNTTEISITTTNSIPIITTTQSSDLDVERGIECPHNNEEVNNRELIYLSSNIDCAKYYICNDENPTPMYCPERLHWNPKTKTCQSPANAKCTISENNFPDTFPICEREKITFHPYPHLCDRFLYCYYGHMTIQYCQFYYYWDIDTDSCKWKTEAKCGSF